MSKQINRLEQIKGYHQRSKHSLQRYAAGPDGLDWDDQPEAFRWYEGCTRIELPLLADQLTSRFSDLFQTNAITPQPIDRESISTLLELALGLSAWKQSGETQWALRCNPSSGNLHPTEGYVILPTMNKLSAGVYHYLSRDHVLEQRCTYTDNTLPDDSFLIGLSSIHWREAWKYGERAYRYCQLDVGHAIGSLRYAAACLGWKVKLLDHWSDDDIANSLGLNQTQCYEQGENEHPDLMLIISTANIDAQTLSPEPLLNALEKSTWVGQANQLSSLHSHDWPIIDVASAATNKPRTMTNLNDKYTFPPLAPSKTAALAAQLIRQRRSAQAFDGSTSMTASSFYHMLDCVLPRPKTMPWDALNSLGQLHLILFVHKVEGLKPGLYVLGRTPTSLTFLKQHMPREEFVWEKPENCPEHLPLYTLVNANGKKLAGTLSCHQGIAAQSCFSLGMLAEFEDALIEPWHYRSLFWEAGLLGQVLYLEAEAAGLRGTGIGCYFDDDLHSILGIQSAKLQSLYHFTVGGPVLDDRLSTLPPYSHLEQNRNIDEE